MSLPEKIETAELGEAMEALSPKEAAFVRALFLPNTTATDAARVAGYGTPETTRKNYARIAFRLRERPSIVKAIIEESARHVKALGPDAIRAIREILADKKHRDRGKMARYVADQISPAVGLLLHRHEHDVTVR